MSAPVVLEPVELDRVLTDHDSGVLVLFDLFVDDVNKKYGRSAGDQVLAAFDEMLQKALRPDDFSARSGGVQFVILLPDNDLNSTAELLTRLRALWERRAPHPCHFIALSVDIDTSGRAAYERAERASLVPGSGALPDPGGENALLLSELSGHDLRSMLIGLRALLRASTSQEVEQTLCSTIGSLGGACIVDADDPVGVVPLDLTAETAFPWVVTAPVGNRARRVLAAALPSLYEDAAVITHFIETRDDPSGPTRA